MPSAMTWGDSRSGWSLLAAVVLVQLIGCGDDGEGNGIACLPELELECDPTYDPTFEKIYANEIESTCGANGSLCHAPEGNKGNLTLAGIDASHEALIGGGLVIPGDPECSVLIQRIESDDPSFAMPPGTPLSAGERCAIRQWVANGAQR